MCLRLVIDNSTSPSLLFRSIPNLLIFVLAMAGLVSTFAGSSLSGFSDGFGIAGSFNGPCHLGVSSVGDVFVADNYNRMIRKISSAGM